MDELLCIADPITTEFGYVGTYVSHESAALICASVLLGIFTEPVKVPTTEDEYEIFTLQEAQAARVVTELPHVFDTSANFVPVTVGEETVTDAADSFFNTYLLVIEYPAGIGSKAWDSIRTGRTTTGGTTGSEDAEYVRTPPSTREPVRFDADPGADLRSHETYPAGTSDKGRFPETDAMLVDGEAAAA